MFTEYETHGFSSELLFHVIVQFIDNKNDDECILPLVYVDWCLVLDKSYIVNKHGPILDTTSLRNDICMYIKCIYPCVCIPLSSTRFDHFNQKTDIQCGVVITRSIFSQILTIDTREGEVWGVGCDFEFWFTYRDKFISW